MDSIRVGEQQPGFCGLLDANPKSVVFAHPALGQPSRINKAQVGDFFHGFAHNIRGPIRRLVVDDKNLSDRRLTSQRLDARGNDQFFVSRRNDGTDEERPGGVDGLDRREWVGIIARHT